MREFHTILSILRNQFSLRSLFFLSEHISLFRRCRSIRLRFQDDTCLAKQSVTSATPDWRNSNSELLRANLTCTGARALSKSVATRLPVLHLRSGTRVMSSKNANKRAHDRARAATFALLREETLILPLRSCDALHRFGRERQNASRII